MVDERPIEPAQQPVPMAASLGIVNVPAVLAMDSYRHARRPRGHDRFQRRQVTCMHDHGAQRLEHAEELRIIAHQMTGPLAQDDIVHVGTRDPFRELRRNFGQRYDGMPPALTRQVIDQVDDPVLEPADSEAEDYVRKQRWRGFHALVVAHVTACSP